MKAKASVLVAAVVACSCAPKVPEKPKARLFTCHRALDKITLDGHITETAWDRAQKITEFTIPGTNRPAAQPATARFLWDDRFLYLAVEITDDDLFAIKTAHDSRTWEDDVCEVFLKPSDVDNPYYEIHITPRGMVLDLLIGRRWAAGSFERWTSWESGIEAKVRLVGTLNDWRDRDHGWVVEAAIPLKALSAVNPKPQLGDRWRFAICRYNYSVHLDGGRELSSSARLAEQNFHRYEDFDYLEFGE